MANNLDDLLRFTSLTHEIRKVKRATWVLGEEQFENDSEHSFQLALMASYLIDTNALPLDAFRAMALALVHDILEVHAGDTPAYAPKEFVATQAAREKLAIDKLKRQWPQFKLLHQLINEFETGVTPEAKFVYALDKLLPMLNNFLDGGRSWNREHISLERVMAVKAPKVRRDPTINHYYQQLVELLKSSPGIFDSNTPSNQHPDAAGD